MTVIPLRLIAAAALLGANLGADAAATVTFDTTLRAGQHQRQLIDMQAVMKMRVAAGPDATDEQRAKIAQAAERMAQMGAMKMNMQMQQTMKVGQADANGWLPLTVTTAGKGAQIEVGGKAMPMPNKQPDLTFAARFNPRDFAFELDNVSGSPEFNELMRAQGQTVMEQTLQLLKALSQRPLKVGDSLELPLNIALPVPLPGGAGAMKGQVRYTLARVDRGVAHFDMGLDMNADVDAPAPAVTTSPVASASQAEGASAPASAAPRQTMKITLKGSGKGTSSLRLADRLPLASQLAMDMKMTMNVPDNGLMLMDMDMVMKSKGESLAKPASTPAKKKP